MGLEAHACSLRVFVTLHVSGAVHEDNNDHKPEEVDLCLFKGYCPPYTTFVRVP